MGPAGPPGANTFSSRPGRYVCIARNDNQIMVLNIGEIQVFGPVNGVETRLAIVGGKQSSTLGGYPNSNVYDNNISTFAHTMGTDLNPKTAWDWMCVDLGSEKEISKVIVYNREDCCRDRIIGTRLEIKNSSENVIWTRDFPATARQYYEFLVRQ